MAKGLAIPVGVDANGRARIVDGNDQLNKLIGLNLSFSDSENPFQDVNSGQIVFAVNDERVRPIIKFKLDRLFGMLEADERAKLVPNSIEYVSSDGELALHFKYWDLEVDEPADFRGTVDLMSGRVAPL